MITTEVENHVATILIDRPEKKNALTQELWKELTRRVDEVTISGDVRLLILKGAGDNFCAGADIGEFDTVRANTKTALEYEAANAATFAAIRNCPVPTIAAIKGSCFGGGFGIAAACDLRIAETGARFCVPPAKLGLAYPVEAMADIVHAVGPQRAKLMAYSAMVIDADTAKEFGFLLHVIEDEVFDTILGKLVATICGTAPLSNRASKASINAVLSHKQSEIDVAIQRGNITFQSEDYAEGRAAFSEKRKPIFSGK